MMNKLNNMHTFSSQAKSPKMESECDSESKHAKLLLFDKLCAVYVRQHMCHRYDTHLYFQRTHRLARDTGHKNQQVMVVWPGTQLRVLDDK